MRNPQYCLSWLPSLLFVVSLTHFTNARAQEVTITDVIVFSETESLIEILLDSAPGEGLSETELIYAASSLLETDKPYIDLASSNTPLNGGYAGAVLSNTEGAKVTISFNSFNESIVVTHISGDPINVEPGHIIVRWEEIEKWVDVQVYGAEIRVRSLAVKLEVAPTANANEAFDFLSIKGKEASEFVLYASFQGSIEGSAVSDTFEVVGPSSDFVIADECANSTGEGTINSATLSSGLIDATPSVETFCGPQTFDATLTLPTATEPGFIVVDENSTEAQQGEINFSTSSESNSTKGGGGSFSFYYLLALMLLAIRFKHKVRLLS